MTISASFGAGGSPVGRAVAERLDLPFLDRAIPVTVAERLSRPVESVVDETERVPSTWERLARAFAYAATPFGPEPVEVRTDDPERYREETERLLRQVADTRGGVILGRAGMAVLAERDDVLRVRLDGPVEARIAQAMRFEGLGEDEARTMQHDSDRARDWYAKVFYRARQDDPSQYHMVLDGTALSFDTCTELIVTAAAYRLGAA